MPVRVLNLVVAALLVAACRSSEPSASSAARAVESSAAVTTPITTELAIPDRANEHVSVAADGQIAAVIWAASTDGLTDIYVAVSEDGGQSFGGPVRVNDTPGDAKVSGEQPPRVALVPRPGGGAQSITALWTARGVQGTKLLTARSEDGGRTFGAAEAVPGSDAAGNRGWQGMAAGPDGQLHAVWLDHRRLAAAVPAGHPHDHARAMPQPDSRTDSVAMAQQSDLYFAPLGPGAIEPRALTAGVCYCCKTAIGIGADGAIHLAWRHVYPGDMRDMAFTTSRDAGRSFSPPVRVNEDGWSVAGCPDDGPAMTLDGSGRVHLVWPTMTDADGVQTKALFHSMTADGRTFTPRVHLPTREMAHHPQLTVAPDNSLAVVWDETSATGRHVVRARGTFDTAGRLTFERDPAQPAAGRYPVVATVGDRLLTAWISTEGETPVVLVESR